MFGDGFRDFFRYQDVTKAQEVDRLETAYRAGRNCQTHQTSTRNELAAWLEGMGHYARGARL